MGKDLSKSAIIKILKTFEARREHILTALHQLQDTHPLQYISPDILDACAGYFKLSKGEIYGLVSYYSMFSLKPRSKNIIRLCKSPVCSMMGQTSIEKHIKDMWHVKPGETDSKGIFTLEVVECLGRCGKAPSMMINKDFYTELSPEKIDNIFNSLIK